MKAEEYKAQVTANLEKYRMGLTLALQELEEREDATAAMLRNAYHQARSYERKSELAVWEAHILKATGRDYLLDILPKLSDFVPIEG